MNRRDVAIWASCAGAVAVTAGVVALVANTDTERLPSVVSAEGGPTRVCAQWRDFVQQAGSEAGARAALDVIVSHYPSAYTDDQIADYVAWMIDNC
jgi:hypothetical protein